jgi:hypothetical protein
MVVTKAEKKRSTAAEVAGTQRKLRATAARPGREFLYMSMTCQVLKLVAHTHEEKQIRRRKEDCLKKDFLFFAKKVIPEVDKESFPD